jgi:ketosteroid isomerase-like protein
MTDTQEWVDRLVRATNAHDLEALVACFAPDYVNVTPAHPARGFVGAEQVRRNWTQIFAAVPDIRVDVVAAAIDGARAWTQWEMRGTRADGSPHRMAGVIVFDVEEGLARKATFFLEPVDDSSGSVDDAVRAAVVR